MNFRTRCVPISVGLALLFFSGCTTEGVDPSNESEELLKTTSSSKLRVSSEDQEHFSLLEQYKNTKANTAWGQFPQNSESAYLSALDLERHRAVLQAVIDPDDFACVDQGIPLTDYLYSTLEDFGNLERIVLNYGVMDFSFYDAVFLTSVDEPQSYGINGEYTNIVNRTLKDLKRFWDIFSDDIYPIAMKGDVFMDYDKVYAIERFLRPQLPEEVSKQLVLAYQQILGGDLYWNYNHPILSYNAVAVTTTNSFIQDRILMGDGILHAYGELGLGDVAAQAILAHEFAHHIQYENDYITPVPDPLDAPSESRRIELMADAYSAYYLTHKRGATLNQKRVEQFLEVFYNIGDCSFDSNGHHGTYEQRRAAARFGFELAEETQKKGQIISSEEFYVLFQQELDNILYCDTCVPTLSK